MLVTEFKGQKTEKSTGNINIYVRHRHCDQQVTVVVVACNRSAKNEPTDTQEGKGKNSLHPNPFCLIIG